MRYLLLVASAACLVARAVAHALRRRAHRVRRYAEDLPAAAPGAVVLQLPTQRTGRPAPALPPAPPRIGGRHRAPEPLDLFAARDPRARAQRRALVVLGAIGHHQRDQLEAVAA
ncbi:hypothetical protein ACOQFV_27210 [Nocardiopsis changdeensis]|uniref:Uncharacterized protein n=1 Tax=Nocardiopsis changdeensis TaxID=2831969 RepID=A0ABX8BRG1_9ACTN|nr:MULTISPECIES: hypothetical protein [Nocardiopsis]QUX22958.1 hypothetical protein KGD84_00670 [Nocardiopsis changdeensis]QYX38901.1 hypothetical protein K1J57_10120 [Nocardiopsis sp. MT53]